MSKQTLTLIILSLIVIIFWIGSTVYTNIFSSTQVDNVDVSKYVTNISSDMSLNILTKVNDLSGNIKVSTASLTTTQTPNP